MAKIRQPDPLTPTRRAALQAFCKSKGWWDGERWSVKEAGDFFDKKPQAMTNLLRGYGSFGASNARSLEEASGGELAAYELDGLIDNDEFQDVLRIDVRLAAGNGAVEGFEEVVGSLKFTSNFLRSVHVSPSKARIVDVRGHSMHPKIPHGAVVLVNIAQSAKEPESGKIFAIARAVEGLSVKRLQNKDGKWFATSDNPEGPTIPIDDGEPVTIVGRVVWMGVTL